MCEHQVSSVANETPKEPKKHAELFLFFIKKYVYYSLLSSIYKYGIFTQIKVFT